MDGTGRMISLACALAAAWPPAQTSAAAAPGDRIGFSADGAWREVEIVRESAPGVWLGSLNGYGGALNATIVETERGWTVDADDWMARRAWRVVSDGGKVSATARAKPASPRRCRVLPPAPRSAGAAPRRAYAKKSTAGLTAGWEIDPVSNVVDILVVFDAGAVKWIRSAGGTTASFAAAQIARMNAALANSGLADDFSVALCGVMEPNLDVTRDCGAKPDDYLEKAIDYATGSRRALWQGIRDERERLGADVVVIFGNSSPSAGSVDDISGTVGIAYGLANDDGSFGLKKVFLDECRETAYAACDVRVADADHTMAHEVGHILGAGHSERLSPDYSLPGPQLFPYSAALMYRDSVDGEYYYTVMGYDSTDGEFDSPTYTEVPYYSSPLLKLPSTGGALGDAKHDNVETMRETFSIVSQYRVNRSRREAEPDEGGGSMYDVWRKTRTLRGISYVQGAAGAEATGVVEVKCGRAGKNGTAKVSVAIAGFDGTKKRFKSKSVDVSRGDAVAAWDATAGNPGQFTLTIRETAFDGRTEIPGGVAVRSASVGGALKSASPTVEVSGIDFAPGGDVLEDLLPSGGNAVPVDVSGGRWKLARAASVSCAKNPETREYELKIDDSRGRTNRSAMKLSYSAKTGVFKGSFRIYALEPAARGRIRLKKYTARINGVVCEGEGVGQAAVARPAAGPWKVGVR